MIKQIAPEELHEGLRSGKQLSVIDVREDEEVAKGMIAGAKHIPLGDIENHLDEIDKTIEHIMVCRSGGRSTKACQILMGKGYKIQNLVGGMIAWEAKYGKSFS
ncbi:rhodanese-related sulfurtransferase [Pullulanibacillus pueri]|uniref:Rhodanese-like domain-containing protein n=1 Tax=Pullulanibacillus pueri TaxID=1437324 RepID=A0A8J2ZUH6_9BACL|nr:rhodanese-like domain-containing protein [Pullulanibacillus pueri]MBM7681202.1 rhodanese-related sulfurtransferase [Pullulanibacillus pueri]GGH78059.1 rhodanese-like domain-containing protein [Pullulanibacillus pueri]